MRKFSELREQVSKSDLDGVEKFADRLFAKVGKVATGVPVNDDATTGAQVTHHVIARYRITTFCIAHNHALGAGDDEARLLALVLWLVTNIGQKTCNQGCQPFAKANLLKELAVGFESKFFECLFDSYLADFAQRQPEVL